MWKHILIILVFYLLGCFGHRVKRIVGGTVAEKGQLPFAVSVQFRVTATGHAEFKHICGGVYVDGVVLTAGHCVLRRNASDVFVQIGETEISSSRLILVTHIASRKLNFFTLKNDIAVISLKTLVPGSLKFEDITKSDHHDHCFIYGFGTTKFMTTGNKQLHFAPVNVIDFNTCYTKMGPVVAPEPNAGMFCAEGSANHIDACLGDSGSALVCKNPTTHTLYPLGLISYGMGCGSMADMPGVYTNITYHLDWIQQKMLANKP